MKHPLEQFQFCPKCGSHQFVVNDAKSKRCEDCGFVYYDNAAAAVAAFIVRGDELLLCTRAKQPAAGLLDLPGGFADHNETIEQTLDREIYEELHVHVASSQMLFSIPNIYNYSGFDVHTLDFFFIVQVDDLSDLSCADDVSAAEFVQLDAIDLNKIGLHSVRQAIEKFIALHKK